MANQSKAKGTRFETDIVNHLNNNGFPHAERRALNGAVDRGDITGIPGIVIEAKATRELQTAEFLRQAETERANADADYGIVVWKRRQQPTGQAACIITLDALTRLLKQAGY